MRVARKVDAVSELRRGALELALLAYLNKKPDFGGAMISGLAEATAQGLVITEGSLYPALGRLEKKGLLTPELRREVEGRKPRKYYAVTEQGVLRLEELKAAWIPLADGMTLLFRGDDDE
jgi:PadR family transcriptional regulator PadR